MTSMLSTTSMAKIVPAAAALGVAGFALENVFFGARYSNLFGGAHVPFLPIYAFGGAVALVAAPHLKNADLPWYARAAAYGVLLSGVEWVGCRVDRDALKGCAWDYSGQEKEKEKEKECRDPARGCIDLPHFVLWGILGLVVEQMGEMGEKIVKELNHGI